MVVVVVGCFGEWMAHACELGELIGWVSDGCVT